MSKSQNQIVLLTGHSLLLLTNAWSLHCHCKNGAMTPLNPLIQKHTKTQTQYTNRKTHGWTKFLRALTAFSEIIIEPIINMKDFSNENDRFQNNFHCFQFSSRVATQSLMLFESTRPLDDLAWSSHDSIITTVTHVGTEQRSGRQIGVRDRRIPGDGKQIRQV